MDRDEVTELLAGLDETQREVLLASVITEVLGASSNAETIAEQFAVLYVGIGRPHLRIEVLGRDRIAIYDTREEGLYGELARGAGAGQPDEEDWHVREPAGLDVAELAWIGRDR